MDGPLTPSSERDGWDRQERTHPLVEKRRELRGLISRRADSVARRFVLVRPGFSSSGSSRERFRLRVYGGWERSSSGSGSSSWNWRTAGGR